MHTIFTNLHPLDNSNLLDEAIIELFKHIPTDCTELDASRGYLGVRQFDILKEAFSYIPEGVTSINLTGNMFFRYDANQLIALITALPKTITHINLNANNLLNPTGKLTLIINALPENITFLSLNQDSKEEKFTPVANIKEGLKILDEVQYERYFSAIMEKRAQLKDYNWLDTDKYAYAASGKLIKELELANQAFFESDAPINTRKKYFQQACIDALEKAREDLIQHTGWQEILSDFASAIISVCSLGLANAVTGRSFWGLFSAQKDYIENLKDFKSEAKAKLVSP